MASIPWLEDATIHHHYADVLEPEDREHYEALRNTWNASYTHMSNRDVAILYARVYNVHLQSRHYALLHYGSFYSRLDQYPYWIRDMLAFRWADQKRINFARPFLDFKDWVGNLFERLICGTAEHIFIREFPFKRRFLWRNGHLIGWLGSPYRGFYQELVRERRSPIREPAMPRWNHDMA